LGVRLTADVLNAATWVTLAAIFIWYALAIWPTVPAVMVAFLSLALVGRALTHAIRKYVATRAGHGMNDQLIVQPITRVEWGRQRWHSKPNAKVAVITGP